jgi:hypothetical protein
VHHKIHGRNVIINVITGYNKDKQLKNFLHIFVYEIGFSQSLKKVYEARMSF